MQGDLDATPVKGRCRHGGTFQSAVAIREQQHGVAMHGPEAAQNLVGGFRQGNETVAVALGIADVHASAPRINIADLKS